MSNLLSQLRPADGSLKKSKRIGRGQGSGKGGTSTKGHKGAQSRRGYSVKSGFEGGQMPIQRRVPKFGFKNVNRVEYTAVNLDDIQRLVDKYQVTEFTNESFVSYGFISKSEKVKILSDGELTTPVKLVVHAFSKKAQELIEQKGGSISKIQY